MSWTLQQQEGCDIQIISVSTTANNDSASCTAVLLAEYDRNGDGSQISVSGFSNQRSHFTNYWSPIPLAKVVRSRLLLSIRQQTVLQPAIIMQPIKIYAY